MNPNQLVQNPFFQEIENPILTRSQNSDLYTILSQGHGYLNIFGECGTGKTTILKALGKIDVKPIGGLGELSQLTQFICLYIDCKTSVISQSPDTFWNVIFKELDRKLKDKNLNLVDLTDLTTVERSNKGLELIIQSLAQENKHLLLALDEFEGLIPQGEALRQQTRTFLTELRGLTNHEPSAILVIGTRCGLEKLWEPFADPGGSSEFPNNSQRFLLGLWKEAEFQAFLERSQVNGQARFTRREMRFIENLSGRHPGLTQKAAKLLFSKRLDENTVNLTDSQFQEISEQFIVDAASTYKEIWRGMDEQERLVMTMIVLENTQGEIPNARYLIENINQSLDQRIVNDLKGRHLLILKDINLSTNKPFSELFTAWIVQEISQEPPAVLQERLKLYGGIISQGNARSLQNTVKFFYENRAVVAEYAQKIIKLAIDLIK